MKNSNLWMTVSGLMGLAFFLIANFTNLFQGSSVIAGVLQLVVNVFVVSVWAKAFAHSTGLKKFVAFFGIVVPFFTASITIFRVFLVQ